MARLSLFCFLLSACTLSSRVRVDAVIACDDASQCPTDWSCEARQCRPPGYEMADPLRPALVFSSPADGATNVSREGDIVIVTSIDVAADSMRSAVQMYEDGALVALTMQPTPVATTWLFRPNAALDPSSHYTVVLSRGLLPLSKAAAPSLSDASFSFDTEDAKDTTPPGAVSDVLIEVNSTLRRLTFANPSDSDLAGVLVVRNRLGTAVVAAPVPGTAYESGAALGNGVVAGVTSEGLLLDVADADEAIEYAFFSFDHAGNYGQGTPAPRMLTQSVTWCPDQTLHYSATSASQYTQALVVSSSSGAGVDAARSNAVGAGDQIVDPSLYGLGQTVFVRPLVTTELGSVLGEEQAMTLTAANRATVSLIDSVAPGGTTEWRFDTSGFARYAVELDESAVAGVENYVAAGVIDADQGGATAFLASKGEFRFRVRPIVEGCSAPGLPTVSAPIRVGAFSYVAAPGRGTQSGRDPDNAKASIADGIAGASAGTEIFVASTAEYTESVHLTANVLISAGYAADFRSRGGRTVWKSPTPGTPALHLDSVSTTISGAIFDVAGPAPAESITVRVSGLANVQIDDCEFRAGSTLGQRSVSLRVDNPLTIAVVRSSFVDTATAGDRVALLSLGGSLTLDRNTFTGPTTATGAHWALDAQQGSVAASGNTVHLGKGARASAMRCADVACNLTGNRVDAIASNGDVIAIEFEGTSTGSMTANQIHAGTAQATSCTGVRLANLNDYTVKNNQVYGGDCKLARGIQVTNGHPLIVYNAIGAGSDNTVGSKTSAFEVGAPSYPSLVNNVVFVNQLPSVGRCVEEVSSPGPNDFVTMSHNALVGCGILYTDEIVNDFTDITAIHALDGSPLTDRPISCVGASCEHSRYVGNAAPAVTTTQLFVDMDGIDNAIGTWDDNDWHLATSNPVLRKGGVDTTTLACGTVEANAACGSVTVDALGLPRTCVTSETDCTSRGPYENDL